MDLEQARAQGIAPWDNQTVDLGSVKIFRDRYPVTIGHRLFVPERDHPDDIAECFQQAWRYGRNLQEQGGCDGFNVGMNWGRSAGQTVMYPHVHCIPRRMGDTVDATGGIRAVVSGQANYKSNQYRNPYDV